MTEPNLKLNIHLSNENNNEEQTLLEKYIQSQLVVVSQENTDAWHDAKELLGKKLFDRDSELTHIKSQYKLSLGINIGLISGLLLYRLFN
jgi:hypothetical protein